MRMIAGLPEVYLHDTYNELTQYGAVVLAANDTLTHTPSKPAGMDDEFYKEGYKATSQSNIVNIEIGLVFIPHIACRIRSGNGLTPSVRRSYGNLNISRVHPRNIKLIGI